ncbi:MAG: penicillin-binding transpeptidase domain-containing protein [Candidatus Paceibacteria bacterium]
MPIRRKKRYQAIEPDEILIDAENLPGFDSTRLEGRIERPIEPRAYRAFLAIALVLGLVFVGQLVRLQVVEHAALAARAEANRLSETLIIAERGKITDRAGVPLALNDPDPDAGFSRRVYPLKEAAAHLVGYVSYPKRDSNGYWFEETLSGRAGVEKAFQESLTGENGAEIQETDVKGDTVSGSVIHAPQSGEDLTLSIDAGLQERLYAMLGERVEGTSFLGGSGVIMDIHTGEVYALASYPSFDPTLVSLGEDSEAIARYVSDPASPFLDRAISGLYTPGSVVKPFVAVAALEEGTIDPEKQILSTGSISIPNPYDPTLSTVFRDWRAHGWVDMRQALAVSSDVYFYAVGGGYEDQQGLGISTIERYMHRFGFGVSSGIALSSEASGIVPNPDWKAETFGGEPWFLGNTYHTAIGQYGFQVTALQLVRATAALANGAFMVAPTLEKGAEGARTPVNIHEENLAVVHEGMRRAVTEGTAAALALPDIAVAGKTGTAEVGAKNEFINSVVIGFFPYEAPRFAFAVIMERAEAGTTAGAPLVMRNTLTWIAAERPEMFE